ncbi:MAG: hypothetical protein OEW00_05000 [candidate division Zixibacteria bacterium]|nr:hypothetical protein [candidate division Zixibacteria bacterium]
MRTTVDIPVGAVMPSIDTVLKGQGIPGGATDDERVMALARKSLLIYKRLCQPTGLVRDISKTDFDSVYHGEGRNEAHTPLMDIYPIADSLALFAITVGGDVSDDIARLFEANDFALGAMLDTTASEGAEMATRFIENHYRQCLKNQDRFDSSSGMLSFCPGYCGWHVSGQKRLFEVLRPGHIGIELNASFLMQPLKSVSGVLVAGPKRIFDFDDDYAFCNACGTHTCRERIKAVWVQ